MRGMTRLMSGTRSVMSRWWTWRLARACTRVGAGLQVSGPAVVQQEGFMVVGGSCYVRSRRHNRVDIYVAKNGRLRLGESVFLNQGVRISCSYDISIGDECLIGDEVVILDSDFHSSTDQVKQASVRIENKVWLATRVIVLRGVTIGEGTVVGAGSVVTHSLPPRCFAAGVPARVIRSHATAAL